MGILFNFTALGIHFCETSLIFNFKMRPGGEICLCDVNMHKGYSKGQPQQETRFDKFPAGVSHPLFSYQPAHSKLRSGSVGYSCNVKYSHCPIVLI